MQDLIKLQTGSNVKMPTPSIVGGSCVRVIFKGNIVAISDTRDPNQASLYLYKSEWDDLVTRIKQGEFSC